MILITEKNTNNLFVQIGKSLMEPAERSLTDFLASDAVGEPRRPRVNVYSNCLGRPFFLDKPRKNLALIATQVSQPSIIHRELVLYLFAANLDA